MVQRWQYKIMGHVGLGLSTDIELNKLGEDGWEICGFHENREGLNPTFIFKRPVEAKDSEAAESVDDRAAAGVLPSGTQGTVLIAAHDTLKQGRDFDAWAVITPDGRWQFVTIEPPLAPVQLLWWEVRLIRVVAKGEENKR